MICSRSFVRPSWLPGSTVSQLSAQSSIVTGTSCCQKRCMARPVTNRRTARLASPFPRHLFKQRVCDNTCFCSNCCISLSTAACPKHFKAPNSGCDSAFAANNRSETDFAGSFLPKAIVRRLTKVILWSCKTLARCTNRVASANASRV